MATTITKIGTPTNLTGITQSGGTLDANTTYYFRVVGWNMVYISGGSFGRCPAHSDSSEEGSFTTDTVNRSVHITWDNASECTHYNVSISTESGVYNTTGCGGYGGIVDENIGNITDGSVGVTITDRSTRDSVFHSDMLVNQMSPHIDNTKGMIMVELSGTQTETLDTIYSDIVNAGYSGYAYYDGYNFVMKGWITAATSNLGLFVVTNKRIIMLKGGIVNTSPSGGYVFRFGQWYNDLIGGNPTQGCVVDCQGSRYNFYATQPGGLLFYDSYLSFSRSFVLTDSENLNYSYYNGGSGSYVTGDISGFNGAILNATARSTTSTIQDVKFGAGNNWSNDNFIRLKIWSSPNMPYSAGLGSFYDCDWNTNLFSIYTFAGYTLNYTNMYNCRFNNATGDVGMIVNPDVRFYVNNNDPPTSDNYILNHYSVNMQVLDINGLPISGVTVNAVDSFGDPVIWIEAGSSPDYLITGNEYTTDRTTDNNGRLFYYLKAYKNYLNPNNTENIAGYSYDTLKDDYYPYTITFSKDGYIKYTVLIEELKEPVTGVVTLKPGVSLKPTSRGKLVLLLNPALGTDSQFFEI